MFTKILIKNEYYIYCKLINSLVFYAENIHDYNIINIQLPISVYCIEKGVNIIGINEDFEQFNEMQIIKKEQINTTLVGEMLNYVKDNNYIEKFKNFYTVKEVESPFKREIICGVRKEPIYNV